MSLKVFSKRCPDAGQEVHLSKPIRHRIWYLLVDYDSTYETITNGHFGKSSLCWDYLQNRLMKEHGWQELRAYESKTTFKVLYNIQDFILQGVHRFVLDAVELFYDLLVEHKEPYGRDPIQFSKEINVVFEDGNSPWRLLEGRIIKVDSQWLETEIHAKAATLLSVRGFDGALAEFQQARSDLTSGDYKGAIHAANLALESTIKSILGIQQEKPGALFQKLIQSGIIPDYHQGFLKAFEDHILRSVPMARNFEKGVGHGQGANINEPPKSLAELAVNLSGVLILFLLKQHFENHSN